MTIRRMAGAIALALVVSELLGAGIHGFLLGADYEPFRGSLLRAQAGAPMLLLPVAHLMFVATLVWVYSRVHFVGGTLVRGAKIGVAGYLLGQAPLWMIWYAEQPWPGNLLVKQLVLELASSIVVGLTIAAVCGRGTPAAKVAPAV